MSETFDPLIDEQPARFVVGIDLGTTNSAVAYVDTQESPWTVRTFSVPQLVAPGVVEMRETLPSFHYEATSGEAAGGLLQLPWQKQAATTAVGVYARDQGGKTPGRLIASAKSWLCHTGVDRTADLLPWQGAEDVQRLSPVEASARVLQHIRAAWNARFPGYLLAEQDVVLTLPASFDEIARELTIEAAAAAKLPRVVLLEEPQAAFYSWVYRNRHDWQQQVTAGQTILVCDIGGGTSDFTLIRVRSAQSTSAEQSAEEQVQFHRIAVGNHLILGGDNLDLALARHLENKLQQGARLQSHQWDVLVRSCQRVKEQLLGEDAPERLTVNLPGSGSRLIGGGLQVEVLRSEVQQLLMDGFLPPVQLSQRPSSRQSGFQEFGLPFAADPAITKYLAAFLVAHQFDELDQLDGDRGSARLRPDVILFNGGFFASPVLRERLTQIITSWYRQDDPQWQPQVLENERLDLAVAHGAAYYGMVRRGEGVRIVANLARSYYIAVESDTPTAVCLVPGCAQPGQDIVLQDRTFQLLVSEPAEFPLLVSSTRLTDQPGQLVEIDREQMTPLPPIRTVLRTRSRRERGTLSVRLHARMNEIGTIDLWCSAVDQDRSWRLQFDIRSATQTDRQGHVSQAEFEGFTDEETFAGAADRIAAVFAPGAESGPPEGLVKQLSQSLQMPKNQWPTPLLRRIWEVLMQCESGRRLSAAHEARWVNLLGFALRPGYGLAVDDWRVAETWRTVQGKLVHGTAAVRNEAQVLWRRIAGGLSRGQQQALADPLLASARNLHRRFVTGKTRGDDPMQRPQELIETWRLLGSLELLDIARKIELGNLLVELLPKRKLQNIRASMVWTLGRLGQRVPLYGPLNTVVPGNVAQQWLEQLWDAVQDEPMGPIAVMQLARRTDDRYRDLTPQIRDRAVAWLEDQDAAGHLIELVREGGQLDDVEQREIFGESLPKGLRLE